jgi:hypothetical protein
MVIINPNSTLMKKMFSHIEEKEKLLLALLFLMLFFIRVLF